MVMLSWVQYPINAIIYEEFPLHDSPAKFKDARYEHKMRVILAQNERYESALTLWGPERASTLPVGCAVV